MTGYEQLMGQKAAESHDSSLDRRDRVLAHEDLVARMKKPPLSMKEPERWSGWIPPRTDPEAVCGACERGQRCTNTQHRARINDSPWRKALVEISAEALRRETEPALNELGA